jgi:hypothetical protein
MYFIFGFSGVLAETNFDNFWSDYLCEYEAICETTLACLSGTYMELIDEKKTTGENFVQLPL